ncbi:MAG: beta-ketoacyl-ACP synthase II [Nitrospinota bacterium]
MKNVVVTGLGLISPLGLNNDDNWNNAINGRSGIDQITRFDTTGYPTTIAGEVKGFDASQYLDSKDAKKMDRFIHYAIAAADLALKDANIDVDQLSVEEKDRTGVIIGVGIGGLPEIEATANKLYTQGPRRVSPFFIPSVLANLAGGQVSIYFGLTGIHNCSVTACASGASAIGDAAVAIERGAADIVVCGGSEAAITGLGIAGFAATRALSKRNDDPTKASRPFDKDRDGFVMGEGAGILVLESLDSARRRSAKIYAKVAGYGSTADAFHLTAPHPEGRGAARCMELAIKEASFKTEDVGYVNAHATSTMADLVETEAIKRVFGEHAYKLNISSTKSMTGHLLGAAGGAEAIFSIMALENGIIPPTINLETPDAGCDLNYTPNRSVERELTGVLSNSFGFGGVNVSLLFTK